MSDDEPQDPLEAMDEEDEEEEILDPIKLKKKGIHVEGEEDIVEDVIANPLLEKDPLLDDEGVAIPDEDDDVELEDPAFKDPDEW